MRKAIILILCFTLLLGVVGCSTPANSNKINVNLDKLKFNEETGKQISSNFGLLFLTNTSLVVNWYNSYIDNPENEQLDLIRKDIDKILLEDIRDMSITDSLNEYEEGIYDKSLKLGMEILARATEDLLIEREELLREKNLKEKSDEDFLELKNKRESHMNTIKELIEGILGEYFDSNL